MMNVLLKCVRVLPLSPLAVEVFLHHTAELVVIDEITIDDWKYLVRLVAFRINK